MSFEETLLKKSILTMKLTCSFAKRNIVSYCFLRSLSTPSYNLSQTENRKSFNTNQSPHCYKTLFPWKSFEEFSKFLISCVTYNEGDLLVLNKPFGIKIHGHDKPGARPKGEIEFAKPNIPECDYTIEDALPVLQKHFNLPSLSIIRSTEKYTTGIVLLSSSDKVTAKLTKSFNIAKLQKKPFLVHWAVTMGYPTVPYRKEKVGIKMVEVGDKMRQPVIETDLSKRSCKLKKVYPVHVESRTISVNEELSTSLVEIATTGVKWHFLRVYASSRVAPILGDVLYGARMKSLLGVPVKTNLSQLPAPEPLPPKLCKKLNLPPGTIGQLSIPTMLHLRTIILPNFAEKNKDFSISADIPQHFLWTVNQLNLLQSFK